jgi:hypothetical protein
VIAETIAAVDRSVSARLEGKLSFLAAIRADGREPFSTATGTATAASASAEPAAMSAAAHALFTRGTARGATLRLVQKAALLVLFLLTSGEDKRLSTLDAGDVLVGKRH